MFSQTFYYSLLFNTMIKEVFICSIRNTFLPSSSPWKKEFAINLRNKQKIVCYIACRIREQAVQAMKNMLKLLLENLIFSIQT